MKITKTGITHEVNLSSSYIIYLFKGDDKANQAAMYEMLKTMKPYSEQDGGFWHVTACSPDCRVPSFFRGLDLYMIAIEHNHGDWNKPKTYELYIVE